ncbi:hypothetical protein P3T76_013022 [Phytophthora citrophthora]|uniref:Transmembrane protein n=1 Tax=Phytophthora citrophthora TaxID=4793 RepID=A0AAD9G519_9STRA|nr:hypothetical protein P3T76_016201 [Phytophthora citrophthora]KAK1931693.1 hypothetical protein P3T76_013022 [Phytophthora citrophthora]
MTLDCRRKSPRWLRLLLDVVLVVLTLLLDVRDLWFKLRWVGPLDTFAFSTVRTLSFPATDTAPLKPTISLSYANQKAQRASGWSSFLDKCESLTPILEEESPGFRYALGRNCVVGTSSSSVKATELVITSSIRADSMAWAACELLYKNRKPPICHSAIVTQFQERYNFQLALSEVESSTVESTYVVAPGSVEEAELIELIEVISKSSPISGTVCVEGFAVKGLGRYSSSVFGCGSPSFFGGVFVGTEIAKIVRNQAWLTSSRVGVMGMSLLVRENRRSVFILRDTTKDRSKRTLEHKSLVNVSASGSLYIALVLVDIALLVLGICSVVEICRCMLWPLWKPLIVTEYQTSSAQTTKLGFGVENYTRVLQIGLLWSSPVALLTVVSRLLTWMLVLPISHLWGDGVVTLGDIHAFLTMIRLVDLVIISINTIWSVVVTYDEKRALAVVRQTFISPLEITGIGIFVAAIGIALGHVQGPKQPQNWQQLIDYTSFENASAIANTFSAGQYSSLTQLQLYCPLVVIMGISTLVAGICVASRFRFGKSMPPRSLVLSAKDAVPAVQSRTARGLLLLDAHRISPKDLTSSSAGILMRPASPPPSPVKGDPTSSDMSTRPAYFDKIHDDRLPIEKLVDIPIRARSIVRRSWALEKLVDGQLLLLPASYLKFGIILTGKSIKTRCGFMDVVQPLVYAKEHEKENELEDEPQQLKENNLRPKLR